MIIENGYKVFKWKNLAILIFQSMLLLMLYSHWKTWFLNILEQNRIYMAPCTYYNTILTTTLSWFKLLYLLSWAECCTNGSAMQLDVAEQLRFSGSIGCRCPKPHFYWTWRHLPFSCKWNWWQLELNHKPLSQEATVMPASRSL